MLVSSAFDPRLRRLVAWFLVIASVYVVLFGLIGPVVRSIKDDIASLEGARQKLAKFAVHRQRLIEEQVSVDMSLEGASSPSLLVQDGDAFDAATSTLAAAAVQDLFARQASSAGVSVAQFQANQRGQQSRPDAVYVTVALTGAIQPLMSLLHAIETGKPKLTVRSLELRPVSTASPARNDTLTATVTLTATYR